MRSSDGRKPAALLHIVMIVCLVVLCLGSVGVTMAKYISESNAGSSASVAAFSPSFLSDNIDISSIKKTGDSVEKTFQVRNYTDGGSSEVALKYKILLNTTGNIPLRFTVLDDGGGSLAVWDCDGTSGQREYEYGSPLIFSPGTAQAHSYTIRAEWLADRNDAQFSGLTDAVRVSVEWEQVD